MKTNQPDTTDVTEDRSFWAFHTFMRASRSHMEGTVYESAYHAYLDRVGANGGSTKAPSGADDALEVLDGIPAFQL